MNTAEWAFDWSLIGSNKMSNATLFMLFLSWPSLCLQCHSFYHRMWLSGKIAGMGMHVVHNTIMKNMREKEIMSVVQLGVIIHGEQVGRYHECSQKIVYGMVYHSFKSNRKSIILWSSKIDMLTARLFIKC